MNISNDIPGAVDLATVECPRDKASNIQMCDEAEVISKDEPEQKKRKIDESCINQKKGVGTSKDVSLPDPNFKKRKVQDCGEDSSQDSDSRMSTTSSSSNSSSSSTANSSSTEDNIQDEDGARSSRTPSDSTAEAESNGKYRKALPLPSKASGGMEEIQLGGEPRMMELLDEVLENDSSEGVLSEAGGDSDSSGSEDVPVEEIDDLLEEGFDTSDKKEKKGIDDPDIIKPTLGEKIILVDKPVSYFDILPAGWIEITHNSGMPIYLHKESRVVSFSRPYWLGPASARRHDVPISAIPCLHFVREKERESKRSATVSISNDNSSNVEEFKEEKSKPTCPLGDSTNTVKSSEELAPMPTGPLAEALKAQSHLPLDITPPEKLSLEQQNGVLMSEIRENVGHSVDPQQVNEYCKKRFSFKTIKIMRFRNAGEKRKYTKRERMKTRPQLPKGSKLISLSRVDSAETNEFRKNWVINPKGKSIVCILHEYVQHALKFQPKYTFGETDNTAMPYSATISINDMIYCTGYGSSKKVAKNEAAEKALGILLPDFVKKISKKSLDSTDTDFSLFDSIRIEDPRIPDLCEKTSEYLPSSILLCCLGRNFGLGGNQAVSKLIPKENQKNEYTMTVGKHTVVVACKNKKDGKQRASQAILQKLHPYIEHWGSLLRLYGSDSNKKIKDLKVEEQQVTFLQSKAEMDRPNLLLIKKLREEMLKLHKLRSTLQPIGTFDPHKNSSMPSSHGSDLNNVDL